MKLPYSVSAGFHLTDTQDTCRIPQLETGVLVRVTERVHALRTPMPFRLDHINLYVLEGEDGWNIVDCGLDNDATKSIWKQVLAGLIKKKPVRRIIVTHCHPDHIGLAAWLQVQTSAPIMMTGEEWETANLLWNMHPRVDSPYLELFINMGLSGDTLMKVLGSNSYRDLVHELPRKVSFICERERLCLTDKLWEVIIGRGHSPAHACLWQSDTKTLLAGDHVLDAITPNISLQPCGLSDPLGEYISSLRGLLDLPCRLVLPSHKHVFTHFRRRIAQLLAHHDAQLEKIKGYCTKPRTVFECGRILFASQLPAHQLAFALGETAAHLIYLESSGELRRFSRSKVWYFENH